MAENKRYYWLKLMDDFFTSKRIKKLRKLAGGDTYTIIYLKMQLLSLNHGGYLEYTGLEDEFYKEVALDIDEDESNVQVTIQYLLSCGLLQTTDNIEYLLPFVQDNLGSETASTQRSRKSRENAQKALQCNNNATKCNNLQQNCNVDIDKDIDKEKDKKENTKRKKFVPPTVDEVKQYLDSVGSKVDAEAFVAFYESKDWMVGKNKMKDWKSAIVTWEKRNGLKRNPPKKEEQKQIQDDEEIIGDDWMFVENKYTKMREKNVGDGS